MAKYNVGDKVKLTARYRGQVCIITEVHEGRPVYQYIVQKERGRGGQYKLSDEQIAEKVGEVDVSTLPQGGRSRTDEATGQSYATQMAQAFDGTPDGDRWLVLATTKPGETLKMKSRGKVVNATLVEVKPRGQRFVFVAQLPTGGTYKWPLSAICIEGEAAKAPGLTITAPPDSDAGTLGDLLNQCQQLLQRGVPANTKVFAASDEEGNSYNTVFYLQREVGKGGKPIIIVGVNHDNLMDDEVFG